MELTDKKLLELKNRFGIAGDSDVLNHALQMALKVASTDITVLLIGESGVGKEIFSKIIHQLSPRKHNNFIAVNCGAIPEGTIDSELFGHEKGAFTSAHEARKGYFETVNGGTIFLDEIGEMPLGTQSRLLRVLENGEFLRVGSSRVQKTDVRVVTATNKNLYEATRKNKFREDLYYRLSTVTIKVPPLRERAEDIPFLFAKFASDASEKFKMPPLELEKSGEEVLKQYNWPGNIRQLKNVIEQISVLETSRKVDAAMLKQYLPEQPGEAVELHNKHSSKEKFQGFEERELLYKFLFEIKRDLSDVKQFLSRLYRESPGEGMPDYYSSEARREENLKYLTPPSYSSEEGVVSGSESRPSVRNTDADTAASDEGESEVEADVAEDETENEEIFSLAEQEKEMIRKALETFKGKRKTAAKKLGISERTLYRKIKEYQLEDL